jgi:tRNA threonylcarbamoyl adenosine modification protein YeaZ/ribosomal-protein-alanine acetyltransferase
MKILALDSSGLVASVALLEENIIVAEYNVHYKKTHSQTMLPMFEELQKMTELSLDSLDAIAIAAGPGSFTGLRIGAATAKALGYALDIPLVEVPTLEGLAFNLCGTERLACPLMDARRGQVYAGFYSVAAAAMTAGSPPIVTEAPPMAAPIEEVAALVNQLGRAVIFLGDGAPVHAERLPGLLNVPYSFAPAHQNRQRAASVAALAVYYLKEGKTVKAADHTPLYFRLPQAEREKEKNDTSVILRPMEINDVDVICNIESRVFSIPWKAEDFLQMIDEEYAHYYVAEVGGKVVGAAGMRAIAGDGQITNILVDIPYRRQGIGRKLLSHMLNETDAEVEIFSLEVRRSNTAAIRLYESMGFEMVGKRPGFYEKPTEDALIFHKRNT